MSIQARSLSILLGCVVLLALVAAPSAAQGAYVFDAKLSLTGDCFENAFDPVPDPGCPGGSHPSEPLRVPKGVAVDKYGNRYVSSFGATQIEDPGSEGRIDVFGPDGSFITEIDDPNGPMEVVVDSQGNLYVLEFLVGQVYLYRPAAGYAPSEGKISYESPPEVGVKRVPSVGEPGNPHYGTVALGGWATLAINPKNDHLFVGIAISNGFIAEFGSAAERTPAEPGEEPTNPLLDRTIGYGSLFGGPFALAIDGAGKRIYAQSRASFGGSKQVVRVYDLEGEHALLATIDGSTLPGGAFFAEEIPLAVNEQDGLIFVGELSGANRRIQVLGSGGSYVETIEKKGMEVIGGAQIALDNSPTSSAFHELYVPAGEGTRSRSLAFGPPPPTPDPPVVESLEVSGVTEDEAVLKARVSTDGLAGEYHFEIEQEGFNGTTLAGQGTTPASLEPVNVFAPATGLVPGASYRYRVVFKTASGTVEKEGTFKTFATYEVAGDGACLNEALRSGPSAALPDCRAYELVTPPSTNGLRPAGLLSGAYHFPTQLSSPDGGKVSFQITGGSLPGIGGTGSFYGDRYVAARGPNGWTTSSAGPSGDQAQSIGPGAPSLDQEHLFVRVEPGEGFLNIGNAGATYVRLPGNGFELVGHGSLGTDLQATGRYITENASHIVYVTGTTGTAPVRLEPQAPPDGTQALYDRTSDGVNHVVSLFPNEVPLAAGEEAGFIASSPEGDGIAFAVTLPTGPGVTERRIYLRYNNEVTVAIAGSEGEFAGISDDGKRVVYLEGGNLKARSVEGGVTDFTTTGDVTPVNIAADGSTVYFISPTALPTSENPAGDLPVPGAENLYYAREGLPPEFVAAVDPGDVEGLEGLGNWIFATNKNSGSPGLIPSRSTEDGSVLLFESGAKLGDYDPAGHSQIYRFDASADTLRCLSCDPTGGPANGAAVLQSTHIDSGIVDIEPLAEAAYVANLQLDGDRAFFESTERLVQADNDGLRDVYEWEEEGAGSCHTAGGCLYLISSGSSDKADYLFAVSDGGGSVFFRTADLLLPDDPDGTPSVYGARVGGGFAPPSAPAGECLGDSCQPIVIPPGDPAQALSGAGNVAQPTRRKGCPKGKRKVKKAGKQRCVRPHKGRHKAHHGGKRTKS